MASVSSRVFISGLKWASQAAVFHANTGENIRLSENNTVATRVKESGHGVSVFTLEPVSPGQMLKITVMERDSELESTDKHESGLGLGFTRENPAESWTQARHVVTLHEWNIIYDKDIGELDFSTDNLTEGQSLGILLTKERDLHWFVDGQWRDVFHVNDCPLDEPMWGMVDLYNHCKQVKAEICTVSGYPPSSERRLIELGLVTLPLQTRLPPKPQLLPKPKPKPRKKPSDNDALVQQLTSTQQQLTSTLQKLTSTQEELTSTQQQLTSTLQKLTSTQEELTSTQQQLTSTRQHLTSTQQQLTSTQQELISTEQQLTDTKQNLSQKLASAQQELANTQQELTITKQQLTREEELRRQSIRESRELVATYRQQIDVIQRRFDSSQATNSSFQNPQEVEFWQVSPEEVTIREDQILGRGAWGYVAKGIFRGTPVAVKRIYPAISRRSTVERIHREIQTMAQVRHPNLVLFIAAVLNVQAGHMILTELLDMSLRSAYEDNLTGANKRRIFRDISSALVYLHGQREPIIHRDVSSTNVLLVSQANNTWLAKLSDFGSANLARNATTPGEGAILYTAPEAYPHPPTSPTPQPPQTTKIDVYSFGVVACEVVTGVFPESDRFRDLLGSVGHVWPQIHPLITSCVSHSPRDRPTMDTVLLQIKKLDWEP